MTTIDELRAKRDVWPTILEHIPHAINRCHHALDEILENPELIEHLERKFRKGEAEHGGKWLTHADSSWMMREAAEEILDFILYNAMYQIHTQAMNEETGI
jgi:hypothetical protein